MRFVKLIDAAIIPHRATSNSAGYDLFPIKEYKLFPEERLLMSTGIAWEDVPNDWVGIIKPRSGYAHRSGIDVLGGVIDADYREEIRVILINHGDEPVEFTPAKAIAQLIILKYGCIAETENNYVRAGGFGSTDN